MKNRFRSFLVAGCCVLVALFTGCATGKKQSPKTYTFFPPAPDEPRLQFLMSFSSDVEFGKSSKFTEFLTGRPVAPYQLVKPYGLASKGGKIYVCDTVANSVLVFDLVKKGGHYLAPQGEGRLMMPINITIGEDGLRYVADTGRKQVVIFNKDDTYAGAIGVKDEMKPCDVAVTSDRLYVGDLQGHAVRVYDKAERKFLFNIPRDPKGEEGKLFSPANLALDGQGRLLVSDIGGFSVQVYDLEGKWLSSFGKQGVGAGAFARPKGVAVDKEGRAYVVDAATQVVQIFNPEGKLLMYFGAPGASTEGGLGLPAGVDIDYENVGYFQKYLAPGQQCEYLVMVANQVGPRKVNVYGFLKKK